MSGRFLKRYPAMLLAGICLTLVLSTGARADIIYEEEVLAGSPPAKLQMRRLVHIKGRMMKEETFIHQAGEVVILRLDKDWIWIGDKLTKTYTEGSWEEMWGRLHLDRPQPVLEIKATGEKKELLGYTAEKVLIKEEGDGSVTHWEVYVVKDFSGAGEVNDFNLRLWQKLGLKSEYQDSWRGKIRGFPLLMIKKETGPAGQEKVTTIRVTSFIEALLDPREFEAPAGFK